MVNIQLTWLLWVSPKCMVHGILLMAQLCWLDFMWFCLSVRAGMLVAKLTCKSDYNLLSSLQQSPSILLLVLLLLVSTEWTPTTHSASSPSAKTRHFFLPKSLLKDLLDILFKSMSWQMIGFLSFHVKKKKKPPQNHFSLDNPFCIIFPFISTCLFSSLYWMYNLNINTYVQWERMKELWPIHISRFQNSHHCFKLIFCEETTVRTTVSIY